MKEEQYLLLQDELDLIIEEVKEKQDRIVPMVMTVMLDMWTMRSCLNYVDSWKIYKI